MELQNLVTGMCVGKGGGKNWYILPLLTGLLNRSDAVIKSRQCGKSRALAETYDDHRMDDTQTCLESGMYMGIWGLIFIFDIYQHIEGV